MRIPISIGSDHAGFQYKKDIIAMLEEQGYDVQDYGCHDESSVDYPDFAHPVAYDIDTNKIELGIVLCGSGNGVAITANKHPQVRCALAWNTETAALARSHNNANIISIPARYVSLPLAKEMVTIFLNTKFEGGRHQRRVEKINL
jgi:ribose 5-phosphate isomerase B